MGKRFGAFGDSSAQMVATGFFTWFNLEAADETAAAGEVVYRPTGEAFHDLVALVARTGDAGRLKALTLKVRRSFIDDPRQGAFARDITKSFLENLSGGDKAAAPLIDEIFHREPTGPLIMRGQPPRLPQTPSQPYQVFVGQLGEAAATVGGLSLTFSNNQGDFRLEAHASGKPKGFFARLVRR